MTTMRRIQKPLWTCPECGHEFVGRNMWHSCSNYSLAHHFEGKDEKVRQIFDKIIEMVRRCGPVTIYAQKTRIVFQVRVRFGGAITHKRWLDASLWLTRRASHACLRRIESFNARDQGHSFRFHDPSQVDAQFAKLVREAYRVGCQEHLATTRGDSGKGGKMIKRKPNR
jgi:hypothetical protein